MQKYIYSETRGGLVPDEPGNNTDAVPDSQKWYRAEDVEAEIARLTAEVERLREALAKSSVTVELKAPDIESIVSDLLPQALRDVASERRRQVEEEGYSHAHDYEPTDDELMNCFDVIRDLKQSNAAKDAEIERLKKWKRRLEDMMPLFTEARDALPAITVTAATLHGVRLDLADRMDRVGVLREWEAMDAAKAAKEAI